MSCKTVSVRRLPRRLDRRADYGGASLSAWSTLSGLVLALTQVGCLARDPNGEGPDVADSSFSLAHGVLHDQACTQADQDKIIDFAVYASASLTMGSGARIVGGNVGVRDPNEPSDQLL